MKKKICFFVFHIFKRKIKNNFKSHIVKLSEIYQALSRMPNATTYLKENVPDEYHFRASDRIGE